MKRSVRPLLHGFRFGMLLQLAVGPVCLFIFQTGSRLGYPAAAAGVLGVTLVDALYMAAAVLGLSSLLGRGRVQSLLKGFSAIVVGLFGLSTLLSAFQVEILPDFRLPEHEIGGSYGGFTAILLTASNPLTILFWAGVFGSKINEPGFSLTRIQLRWFAFGALLATFIFLNVIAWIGSLANAFIAPQVLVVLNVIVGFALMFYAVRIATAGRNS